MTTAGESGSKRVRFSRVSTSPGEAERGPGCWHSDALVGVNLTALREGFGPGHCADVKRLLAMDGVKVRTPPVADSLRVRAVPKVVFIFIRNRETSPFVRLTQLGADYPGAVQTSPHNVGLALDGYVNAAVQRRAVRPHEPLRGAQPASGASGHARAHADPRRRATVRANATGCAPGLGFGLGLGLG